MKGSYVLLISNDSLKNIRIGHMGIVAFKPGYYAYVGSALNNMEKRIRRHVSPIKKVFWHIDYLLRDTKIVEIFSIECSQKLECEIADILSLFLKPVPKFGCSDCSCISHLFYHNHHDTIKDTIESALKNTNLPLNHITCIV